MAITSANTEYGLSRSAPTRKVGLSWYPSTGLIMCRYRTPVLLLTLALVATPGISHAYHEASEPSDGTVRSFKAVNPPKAMPETMTVVDGDNQPVAMSSLRGKVLLINLWATWCPPCVRELPALDALQARFKDQDLKVVTISVDEGGTAQAGPFFERLGIRHLPLYADALKQIQAFFPIDVLPASFIADREGRITHFLRSYVDWAAPESDQMFRELIADGASSVLLPPQPRPIPQSR